MPIVVALAAGIVWMLVRKREPVLLILIGAIAMPIAIHLLNGTLLPLERATLFYLPLYAVALLDIEPRIVPIVGAIGLAHFAWTYNPHTCFTWGYDRHDVEVLERIDRDRGGRNVLVGISWQFEPSLNFYRRTRHYTWLAPLTRYMVRLDGQYVYAFESDVDPSKGTVLARYPDTKTILLRIDRVNGGAPRATPPLLPRPSC